LLGFTHQFLSRPDSKELWLSAYAALICRPGEP
jgi:hypothetical protein